jgi:PH (Pleckstrin Homology) domain-containing protein
MRFSAPWDGTLRVVTGLSVVAMLGLAAAAISGAALLPPDLQRTAPIPALALAVVLAAAAATIGLSWALAPQGFTILGDRLRIERPLRPIDVPLREIRAACALPDGFLAGSIRVLGSGGLFGYYGRFWKRRFGSYRMYATRRTGLVLVEAGDRFVLSPEPADRFLEALLSRAPAAARAAMPR